MGIYIKGMEMPTEEEIGKCIIIRHDGEVWIVEFDNLIDGGYVACYPTNPMRAISVPPHGRSVDADALLSVLRLRGKEFSDSEYGEGVKCGLADAREFIKIAPTIIPASEEGER